MRSLEKATEFNSRAVVESLGEFRKRLLIRELTTDDPDEVRSIRRRRKGAEALIARLKK